MELQLTQGYTAKIDPEDYERVKHCRWRVAKRGKRTYVMGRPGGRRSEYLHRFVMSADKGTVIDHVNFDTLDNRRCNLRVVSRTQNSIHSRKLRKHLSSQFKGVRRIKTGWAAHGQRDKKTVLLGVYDTERNAALAYDRYVEATYGEYAVLNFPGVVEVPVPRKQNRAVEQLSRGGILMKAFGSVNDAARLLNISAGNISEVCNGKRRHANGFVFRFKA